MYTFVDHTKGIMPSDSDVGCGLEHRAHDVSKWRNAWVAVSKPDLDNTVGSVVSSTRWNTPREWMPIPVLS